MPPVHMPKPQPPAPDFRTRTCGECAWAILENGGTVGDPEINKYFRCRRLNWHEPDCRYYSSIPACPAFVAKEPQP